MGVIISINVGQPRTVEFRDHTVSTGIYKLAVEGAVRVESVNLIGDDQADRRVHGGVHKAVYAYASEDYGWWSRQLDRAFPRARSATTSPRKGSTSGQRWSVSAGASATSSQT